MEVKENLQNSNETNKARVGRYSMILPPPNITGNLHLGHTLTCTIQDVIVRYKISKGENVIWIPGTDHAGIATQVVVEKNLYSTTGKTRHDLGRDEFIKNVWKWKEENKINIERDLKKLGCCFNWDKEYFTLNQVNTY